jgi:outer membrane murein-binding lipoprotein Lpp
MQKRLLLSLITVVVLASLVLSGCQTTGISQAQYDQVAAQLADAQSKLAKAQADLAKAQTDKAAAENQVKDLQAQVASLQTQVNTLKGQTTLTGATLAETATKIVKNYKETHVYSTYDMFVCSDMASEVWNMLKAKGINSVVVVGNKDVLINDILQSNHAWVLATVDNNELLALEATSGSVYKSSDKPLYYTGWSFKSPADLKSHNDWVKEYNTRVVFRNQLNTEANKAFSSGNDALYAKLVELRSAQETELNGLMSKIKALATQIY